MPVIICKANPDQTCDATLADGNRRLPIRVRRLNDRTLLILPDDLRDVVSTIREDNTWRFGIGPGRNPIVGVRHAQLTKAGQALAQLAEALKPLMSGSDNRGIATEALGLMYIFLAEEREDAAARSNNNAA